MIDNPCPCSGGVFPLVVFNPPAQPSIVYRWGDYDGFRNRLLQPLDGETQLTKSDGTLVWRPAPASGNLALQIAEWWAYLSDILTLYTERAANQAFLGTADLPESLPRLVPILGYRPRPGIGALLTLAGLARGPRPVALPQGLQVQSKPGPGQQPQVYELAAATTIQPVAPIATVPQVTPMPAPLPPVKSPGSGGALTSQVVLSGKPSGLKVGDEVLLLASGWTGQSGAWAVGNVSALTPAGANTTVSFVVPALGPDGAGVTGAANWRLLKASGFLRLYPYLAKGATPAYGGAPGPIPTGPANGYYVQLASIVRSIAPGDIILVENPSAPGTTAAPGYVTVLDELIYYANNPSNPGVWPPSASPPPTLPAVPIPNTVVYFQAASAPSGDAASLIVRYGFSDVGTLVDVPVTSAAQTGSVTVDPTAATAAGLSSGGSLLVADANGDGGAATLGDGGAVAIDASAPPLTPPIRVLSNLLAFTRGKTVAQEVLGNGNAAVAGQDFMLKNSPVTYLSDQPGRSGPGYSSTITLWVNGVQWLETPSFYGQAPNGQVFTTYEDIQGNTHVLGGDGLAGARFPTGTGNIVATYRIGSGAALPPPTSVTVLLQPQPGLQALLNPTPPHGGADPDAAADLRTLAPKSVLTFGRAVSVDDYAAVAAATAGVARVSAAYAFDPVQQRPAVTLWVGDDPQAVTDARNAITPISDPNRPIIINTANPAQIEIAFTYVRDPRYQDTAVLAAVRSALLDPDAGLFGSNIVQIGQAFYDSQIYKACLGVPGVQAVHGLTVTVGPPLLRRYVWQILSVWAQGRRLKPATGAGCSGHRYDPGPDGYFTLAAAALQPTGVLGS